VQRDGQDPKPERAGPLEKLVRRVIERIQGIIESVNMQIDLDPVLIRHGRNLRIAPAESTALLSS
jgi:hypothetical protein